VSALGETISKQQAASQAAVAAAQAVAQKAQEEEASIITPTQLYRSAKSHLRKKNYALAAEGFQAYLKHYPKGANADWATFSLGESYFGLKSWEDAAKQYATVLDNWPQSQATAAARYKYAVCLIKLKKNIAEAKRYLQSIPEDFPKSYEASEAAKLLKNLAPVNPAPSK